jgi:hypothetical protein
VVVLAWAVTAAQYEDSIKSGQLTMVVSNLDWTPEKFLDTDSEVPEREIVDYKQCTFRELMCQTIILPNGREIPLKGNVDVLHESHSLSRWSQVPELDMLIVPQLLSVQGTYFISPTSTPCFYDMLENRRVNQAQRKMAVDITRRALQRDFGLVKVQKVEAGLFTGVDMLYTAFRRSEAPEVEI